MADPDRAEFSDEVGFLILPVIMAGFSVLSIRCTKIYVIILLCFLELWIEKLNRKILKLKITRNTQAILPKRLQFFTVCLQLPWPDRIKWCW